MEVQPRSFPERASTTERLSEVTMCRIELQLSRPRCVCRSFIEGGLPDVSSSKLHCNHPQHDPSAYPPASRLWKTKMTKVTRPPKIAWYPLLCQNEQLRHWLILANHQLSQWLPTRPEGPRSPHPCERLVVNDHLPSRSSRQTSTLILSAIRPLAPTGPIEPEPWPD